MFCTQSPITFWKEFQGVAQDFLGTGEDYLLLPRNSEEQAKIMSFEPGQVPDLDLIQFCSLSLLERGELGIREIHWKVSDSLTGSRAIDLLMGALAKIQVQPIQKLHARYLSMQNRKQALVSIIRGFALLGIVIPHYIEPRNSSLVMSRSFVKVLLEFNAAGELSLERAFFALARTANYKCVRISELSH
jgi:hypothetical protein